MPSWKFHKRWGKELLGYFNTDIDRLIDCRGHDLARRIGYENLLRKQVSYVKRKYGKIGVYYYILHHILDTADEQLLSILWLNIKSILFNTVDRRISIDVVVDQMIRTIDYECNHLYQYAPKLRTVFNDRDVILLLIYDLIRTNRRKVYRKMYDYLIQLAVWNKNVASDLDSLIGSLDEILRNLIHDLKNAILRIKT